jgi:hypothetical protein
MEEHQESRNSQGPFWNSPQRTEIHYDDVEASDEDSVDSASNIAYRNGQAATRDSPRESEVEREDPTQGMM